MNCVSRVSGPGPTHPLATGHMQDEYVGVYVDGADNVINVPLGRLPFADYRNNLIVSIIPIFISHTQTAARATCHCGEKGR